MRNLEPVFGTGPGGGRAAIVVDEGAMTVEVEAGMPQRTLLDYLADYRSPSLSDGLTIPAFSWFIDQTMGGAIATATHGSSLRYGSLSDQVVAMEVVLANGTRAELTRESDPHLFRAFQTSVGNLGIVTRLTMLVEPQTAVRRELKDVDVESFVREIERLQARYKAAVAAKSSSAVVAALEAIDEVQALWFVPTKSVWRVSFTRIDREPPAALLNSVPGMPGVYNAPLAWQDAAANYGAGGVNVPNVTAMAGDDRLPMFGPQERGHDRVSKNLLYLGDNVLLSNLVASGLRPLVYSGTFERRKSYLTMSEIATRAHSTAAVYDQYEVFIPLDVAGDCLRGLTRQLYGSAQLSRGFTTPMLVRFNAGSDVYLSPTNGGPRMSINLEDYRTHQGAGDNAAFKAAVRYMVDKCQARLHWGKAGWEHGVLEDNCFDGAAEYGADWCAFGCAALDLDPARKFAGDSGIWSWRARERGGGEARDLGDLAQCCTADGFDAQRCTCAASRGCAAISFPEDAEGY
ncbi:unnamed protein product [Pedinophyceae sp. YPF-701]|nr:unnamed protein product [Pedinophyceae sp. YPF-701]